MTSRPSPPTLQAITDYVEEYGAKVDPAEFLDYYTQNGWRQGKSAKPIKDWHATVRQWHRTILAREKTAAEQAKPTSSSKMRPLNDAAALARMRLVLGQEGLTKSDLAALTPNQIRARWQARQAAFDELNL